ncbi:HAD-IIB family hydrolase [Rhizobium sp. 9140]|uniref:HAD-IIB family hydrolase n=1 Tax=Rhizobium sp. 9140 TaxID=1761900 RepID=UPI00079640FD|nr:HAD-IIB family hydrolase [Rhizobium sp. 9140]CZT37415.1 sucrose-phosphate synthase [Rhizobium sp. 9140]
MFVLHVALQGCLRGNNVEYGLTTDTGGHIRYLLDLVEACRSTGQAERIVIATRAFEGFGEDYIKPVEIVDDTTSIIRFPTAHPVYLAKEDLHTELKTFADGLIAHIVAGDTRPDILHAHYADAAVVATRVEEALGIPFVFTGHSLGKVKQKALPSCLSDRGFAERIAAEELALARASLVIASSRDEAELQYKAYDTYDPGKIRVLPPGSDLKAFRGAASSAVVEREMARFLVEPEKPVILAIARPVAKKNLAGLIEAYGKSEALQAAANLVIVAGSRDDIDALEADMAANLRELLRLIDRYDLYGKVAYPKSHRGEDIPAYYAYARDRRGVFVNPAFNEPFGLTLLEAAAVGLPLVATDSGGPNDIIETCSNGLLVDPRDANGIADALLQIFRSAEMWDRFSASGDRAVKTYDWERHVTRYHGLVRDLVRPPKMHVQRSIQLLISDIDNTLVGSVPHLHAFGNWRRMQENLAFGVATGRSFHSAMAVLEQQDVPRPEVMITSVGSEIYTLSENGVSYEQDEGWLKAIAGNWQRSAVERVLRGVSGLTPQAPLEQRDFKLSYFSDGTHATVERVRSALQNAGLLASVIHSHKRYLDILPIKASKGTAVDHVRRRYGLVENAVFVAGDSGNDIEMLQAIPQSIIVANYSDNLGKLPALKHSYIASNTHAAGIIEGVLHFRNKAKAAGRPA